MAKWVIADTLSRRCVTNGAQPRLNKYLSHHIRYEKHNVVIIFLHHLIIT
jgi:hypothetical protein